MSFDFDPIYLIYVLVAASAGLFAEGFYLLCFTGASYRNNVNRRLKLLKDQPDRENILIQLRRERGLTSSGGYSLTSVNFNQLVLQSGLTVGIGRLVTFVAIGAVVAFAAAVVVRGSVVQALLIALFCGLVLPYPGAALPAQAPAEGVRGAVPRCARHDRAQPARRPSGSGRHLHGGARDARSDRQRVRHRRRRDHLRGGSGIRPAQPLFPRRPGRPAAVRDRGRDPGHHRRQSRRDSAEPVDRHSRALQDAPQDPRARRRGARLGLDPVLAADRDLRR